MNKHIELARDLRKRINHAYAAQCGTASYERRECAEAIEDLVQRLQVAESQRDDSLFALAIAKAQASEPAPKPKIERDTIAVNLMRLTSGLDKNTARLIADQCVELAISSAYLLDSPNDHEAAHDAAQWLERLQAVEAQRDELLNALESIQSRIRESAELPVATGDVFDSFYRDVIDAAIAKAQASEPAPKLEWVEPTDQQILDAIQAKAMSERWAKDAKAILKLSKKLNHGA
jgi:hypothetical protein